MNASRRQFFKASAGLAAAASHPLGVPFNAGLGIGLAGLGALAAQRAEAADTSGYKALVCLFFAGGSDQHNWVVPVDAAGYAQYAQVRRELAWPTSQLLPITSTTQGSGRAFAMPLQLQPIQQLYQSGQAAVVANVGPLLRPISKAEYTAGTAVPRKLFSHNDQQSTWQSLGTEGAPSGWGGRMGDVLMSANQYPVFTAVSAAGNAVFLAGSSVTQYQLGGDGAVAVRALTDNWVNGSSALASPMRQVLAAQGSNPFQAEYTKVMQRSIDTQAMLQQAMGASGVPALPTVPLTLPGGGTLALDKDGLARQLRLVAQMVAAGGRLGMRRQVFMVQIGGFDSHNNQMRDQPVLMNRVSQSVGWFMQTLAGLGLQRSVTLFTASDFGRTLVSNGDGSDHGWGSHHFVIGGAVKGRTIAGRFPVTALGTNDDVGSGRLLPSTSVTELAAELGGWMGLSRSELQTALPNLGAFNAGGLGLF